MERGVSTETHNVHNTATEQQPAGPAPFWPAGAAASRAGSPLPVTGPERPLPIEEKHVFHASPRAEGYAAGLGRRQALIFPLAIGIILLPRLFITPSPFWTPLMFSAILAIVILAVLFIFTYQRYYSTQVAILDGDTLRVHRRDVFTYKQKIAIKDINDLRLHQSRLMQRHGIQGIRFSSARFPYLRFHIIGLEDAAVLHAELQRRQRTESVATKEDDGPTVQAWGN